MANHAKYKPEFAQQAEKLCLLGATDANIADFFEVAPSTLYTWRHNHPEFAEALKSGKDTADERVERSLYQKAVGYELEVEELFCFKGDITRATTRKYFAPDTVACIFWLKNRRREAWRDVHKLEHTGKDGSPIQTEDVSPRDKLLDLIDRVSKREQTEGNSKKPH